MDQPIRSFVDWLAEHRAGRLNGEVSYALAELTEACRETGKTGKLVITIAVASSHPGADTVAVTDDVKLTKPRPARAVSVYYDDGTGSLVRDDPSQLTLDGLRSLPRQDTDEPARRLEGDR